MLRHPDLPGLRMLLATVLLSACHTPTGLVAVTPVLKAGQPEERVIRPGETHTYRLPLTGHRYLRIYATQKSVDLALELIDPSGSSLDEVDGAGIGRDNEVLIALAETAGDHLLRVTARGTSSDPQVYEVTLAEDREASPEDPIRIPALRGYVRALNLDRPDATPQDHRAALDYLEEAERTLAQIDDPLVGWTLLHQAKTHLALEEPEAARRLSREALANLERHGHQEARVDVYNLLGDAMLLLGRPGEALEAYGDAIRLGEELGVTGQLAQSLNDRGILHRQSGDLDAARDDLERAIRLWREFGEENPLLDVTYDRVTAMINLGIVYRQRGETERALALYEQAAELTRQTGWSVDELHLYSNLGRYYIAVGRLEEAHRTLTRGLELARRMEKPSFEQPILSNLGLLYRLLGQPEEALESYSTALELSHRQKRPERVARNLLGIGKVHQELGNHAAALDAFHRALTASRESVAVLTEADALRESGVTLAELGSPEEGLQLIEQAIARSSDAPAPMVVDNMAALARVQESMGRLREARSTLRRATDLKLEQEDPLGLSLLSVRLARLERALGDLEAAQTALDRALTTHEQLRARLVSPDQRATFQARWRDHYRELIDLLVERSEEPAAGEEADTTFLDRALTVSERSRARVLVELLTEARVDVRGQVDPSLLEQERSLLTRLSLLQTELLENRSVLDSAQRQRDRLAMQQASAELAALEQRMRRTHRQYAELRYPEPLDAAEVQGMLPRGTVLLEYTLGPEGSHLFLVEEERISHHTLPPAAEIGREIQEVRQAMQAGDPRASLRLARSTETLYRWLLAPVAGRLQGVERVWIVPDGVLYYLPFELLRPHDGSYVLDRWTSGYAPSATTLASLRPGAAEQNGPDHGSFVAFAAPTDGLIAERPTVAAGNRSPEVAGTQPVFAPLPASTREVRSIAELFPGRSRLFLGPEAHKSNVIEQPVVGRARWLHFASHAWIDEQAPARSAIILSPDPHGDALLSVSDIFNLRLSSEAVVLSACDTGLGEEVDGEGIVGFTRAFFYAGTPNVVVSLWPVADEATAALMQRMYAELTRGHTVAGALREAKRALIADTPFAHPRYWAPFVLIGEPGRPSSRNIGATGTAQPHEHLQGP